LVQRKQVRLQADPKTNHARVLENRRDTKTIKTGKLRIGVVQLDCQAGQVQENLSHAAGLVERAAQEGAQLVLLPELMPSGYFLTEEIWDCAEPWSGPTCSWLASLARRLGIYVGTSFLEAEGEDFYNTFALAAPDGGIAGRTRKSPPASLEAYFYRSGDTPHVIETELGRIGVGICYENFLFERLEGLAQASVDLVLQPAAAGRLKPFKPGDLELFDRMVDRIAPRYARALGVPVALANRAGQIHTPLPGANGDFDSSFPGLSQIVDSNAVVRAKLGEEEGVIVAEVRMDPSRKRQAKPRCYGKMWAIPTPWFAYIWPLTQKEGEEAYAKSEARRERAGKMAVGF
jgi:N-carbamoylputrescine amidase